MNILEGVKPSTQKQAQTNKFIIKSKPSTKQNKHTEAQGESANSSYASNQDVHQLLTYIITKSKRLSDFLESKGISDTTQFNNKNLYQNPCIRTFLKSIMDKMLAERRLGKNLKGINKGILTQIENSIWSSLQRQVALYQLDKMYEKQKSSLESQLMARKKEIEKQIQFLHTQELELERGLILKQQNKNQDQIEDF